MPAPWFSVAIYFKGITEVHGSIDDLKILEIFRISGHPEVKDDEATWSAALLGACLRLAGYRSSEGLGPRSYETFGDNLKNQPRRGCIVILRRGGPKSARHVAFYDREDDDHIVVVGGTHGGGVAAARVSKSRVIAYRWPVEPMPLPANTTLPDIRTIDPTNVPAHVLGVRPVALGLGDGLRHTEPRATDDLSEGSAGPQVRVLQAALVSRNFQPGSIDGEFGPLTRAAVLAFQTTQGLPATGRADGATRRALKITPPAPPDVLPGPRPFDLSVPGPGASERTEQAQDLLKLLLSALSGKQQSAPRPATPPAPTINTSRRQIVNLLYATTRRPSFEDSYFSGERSDKTTYGTAIVRVPETHQIGKVEQPFRLGILSLTFYEEALDPRKHFVIEAVSVQSVEAWTEEIRGMGVRHALVFVHGFNTTFRDAVLRGGQIMWDLQYKGVPVLFSWPSRGRVLDYVYDHESAIGARDAFIELLRRIRLGGIERIDILAHSMGNLVVLDALANHLHTTDPLGIAEVLMAAPDVDKDHFIQIAGKVRAAVSGMTLYASSADRALAASKRLAGNIPRAGDVPEGRPILVDDVDTIDVTPIGEEFLGHGTYASTRSVLNDIGLVLSTGTRPPSARLVEIRGMPMDHQPPKWWRYSS